jgi:hypothetical protein
MPPRISSNRVLLITIAIAIVLVLGMGWILLTGDPGRSPIPATAVPSSFSALETEPLTPSFRVPFAKDDTFSTATETGPDASPGPPAETLSPTSTLTETPVTPSTTPTPAGIQPLRVGQYDDTDPNIAYDPHWTFLKNPSTAKSYKGTIHASYDAGSEASFRFTGKQILLGYKRGKNFGTVTVMIDDQPYSFYEQALDLVWRSPQLPAGDHFVRIIHESGESVNLDYIVVVE